MYNIILAFITAFLLTYRVIPAIIDVAYNKKLYDIPDDRKSHTEIIPRLGGISIFAGLLFSIILWTPFNSLGDLQYILSAFIIIFLIGAKDDIEPVSPLKKFGAQVVAAFILVFQSNVRISELYGIFGIHEIPFLASAIFSMFVIIAIINAFNLIDGVNGLAGTIGLLSSIVFGYLFYEVDRIELSIVAFAMAGSIIAFLNYNYTPAKIFMGDTGSLLIGLVSAVLAIKFFEINKEQTNPRLFIQSGPIFAISVLIIPIFDTVRIMSLRILKGKSPFHPDRGHIHHLLLDLGFTHMEVTAILVVTNAIFIYIAYSFQFININLLFLIIVGLALMLTGILVYLVKRKKLHIK